MDQQGALKAITEAETSLMRVSNTSISELMSLHQPDTSVLSLLEALVVILAPSKRMLDWNYARKWLNGNSSRLLPMLKHFKKDQLTEEQLNRLKVILVRDECAPERVRKCSVACYEVCVWLNAVAQYLTVRRQLQQTA